MHVIFFGLLATSVLGVSSAQARDIRFMSFNIRYGTASDGENSWEYRKELVADTILARDPDVIGLQEVKTLQKSFLEHALRDYDSYGALDTNNESDGEYGLIFVKRGKLIVRNHGVWWLSESPEKPGSKAWGATKARITTWVAVVNSAGQEFLVFNTHWCHRSRQARENSARLTMNKIPELAGSDPFVLMGDLNSFETDDSYALLTHNDNNVSMIDTFRYAHPVRDEHEATVHGFKGTTLGSRIDFIFTDNPNSIIRSHILRTHERGRYPSDHYPIEADLRMD